MPLPDIKKDAVISVLTSAAPLALHGNIAAANVAAAPARLVEPTIQAMLATMQNTEFMSPFDWQAEFQGREAELNDISYVRRADLETLRKLMTAHVRIDRLSEGEHLNQLIASGYWGACLARMDELSLTM